MSMWTVINSHWLMGILCRFLNRYEIECIKHVNMGLYVTDDVRISPNSPDFILFFLF